MFTLRLLNVVLSLLLEKRKKASWIESPLEKKNRVVSLISYFWEYIHSFMNLTGISCTSGAVPGAGNREAAQLDRDPPSWSLQTHLG